VEKIDNVGQPKAARNDLTLYTLIY